MEKFFSRNLSKFIFLGISLFIVGTLVILFIDSPNLDPKSIELTFSEKISAIGLLFSVSLALVGIPSAIKIYKEVVTSSKKATLEPILEGLRNIPPSKIENLKNTIKINFYYDYDPVSKVTSCISGLFYIKNKGEKEISSFIINFYVEKSCPARFTVFKNPQGLVEGDYRKYSWNHVGERLIPPQETYTFEDIPHWKNYNQFSMCHNSKEKAEGKFKGFIEFKGSEIETTSKQVEIILNPKRKGKQHKYQVF